MNEIEELVYLQKNEPFTDSKIIAEATGNQHPSIQRIISKYENDFLELGQVRFEIRAVKYKRGTNEEKVYLLNEQQATLLITYLRNTEKVRAFKKELVKQFYELRAFAMQKQTQEWEETRRQSKLTRNAETGVLKELVEYAEAHGSKNAQRLYVIYTRLANKTVGIKSRELATAEQLNTLEIVERIILNAVKEGIKRKMEYHEIYLFTKEKLMIFQQVAYLA